MTIIVLTKRPGHKQERSWACASIFQASNMLKFLTDNKIDAIQVTQEQWDALPDYEEGQ